MDRGVVSAAATPDVARMARGCKRCGADHVDTHTLGDVPYASLASLLPHVRNTAARLAALEVVCACGARLAARQLTLEVASSAGGAGAPLVLTATRQLWGWTVRRTAMSAREESVLRRDALLRRCHLLCARSSASGSLPTAALPALSAAARALPGDGELLAFVPRLHAIGQLELALAICETRVALHPADAAGQEWLGVVVLAAVERRLLPERDHLRGEAYLRATLLRDAGATLAATALARCLERRGQRDEARRVLETAAAARPDALALRVALGTLVVSDDAAGALVHIEQALRLAPDDIELPALRIRTLVHLGRLREAQSATNELRERQPEHRALRELIGLVARARVAQPEPSHGGLRLSNT